MEPGSCQVCCLPHGTKKVNFCRDKFEEKHFPSPEWSLWYFEKEAGKSWQECQHEVASCKSIEEFWILHHSIRLPSEINIGCDYALFRNPIKPMWEDERNKNGGRWVAVLNKTANWNGFNVNGMWLEIVQHFIGGSLAYAKNICGVVFNNRGKCFKIAVWINTSKEDQVEAIGNEIRRKIQLNDNTHFVFEPHLKSSQST